MINYRKMPVYLLFVIALLFAAGAVARGGSITPENKVPDTVESKAQSLMDDLKQQGFEVSRGYFKLWTIDDCDYTFDKIGSCYANNPAAPYAVFAVPPWPEEFVDPIFSNIWGPSKEGYNDVYRLDPREAIIILGQLPPPGAFFSDQTWIFTREGAYDKDSQRYKDIEQYLPDFLSDFFATVPGHPERIQVASSLSNTNNNVVIERQSGAAFDQIRYFIITPDQVMDQEVREAFNRISVEEKDVFTEPIPSASIKARMTLATLFAMSNLMTEEHRARARTPGERICPWLYFASGTRAPTMSLNGIRRSSSKPGKHRMSSISNPTC
jgi:hypothetical protein